MATKTVVCPECGSAVAPGRYACAECGSLLASVTAVPRAWGRTSSPIEATEPAEQAEPAEPNEPAEPAEPSEATERVAADEFIADAVDPDDQPVSDHAVDDAAPTLQPSPAEAPVAAVASAAPNPMSPARAWPPAGDRGPAPLPVARTPAGAYLPPSAVLDALDPATASTAGTAVAPSTVKKTDESASRGVDLRGMFGSLGLADDAPRTIIAVGAATSAIGFLLPWASVLAGAGLLGGYFTQWGLAGPGHWIVVTLLLATVVVALAGAPTARWPVRFAAIALAALLVGMLWPYLFGFLGRSVGVWVVLAGAVVLGAGGVLDSRDRHDPEDPTVG